MEVYANRMEACLYGNNNEAKQCCLEDLKLLVSGADEPHRHTLRVCPVCGQLEWMSSKPAAEESFELDYQETAWPAKEVCDNCRKASLRNPELWVLVQWMISHALHMEKKKKEVENG